MDLKTLRNKQNHFFESTKTLSLNFRKEQLKKLKKMIVKYENDFIDAMKIDIGKSEFETITHELLMIIEEINLFNRKLKVWMKHKNVKRTFSTLDSKSMIINKPFGVSLIISPWNYPIQLTFMPLIGSIAAGNTSIILPSDVTPTVYDVIYKSIKETFDENYITVVDRSISPIEVSDIQYDKIFFTGSPRVGKIIMEKSSKYLTSITLELGGKSPTIIDNISKGKLKKALKRIIWGKFINGGQTCVATDYMLVNKKLESIFLDTFKKAIKIFESERKLHAIVNDTHYKRIKSYFSQGNILYGGESDGKSLEITLIKPDSLESPIMQEEIFGPVIPIIYYENKSEAKKIIDKVCPHPLSMYLFSEDESFIYYFIQNISYGGCSINDTISQIVNHNLPFGGVSTSGIGSYHGYESFKCFSKETSILKKDYGFELPFRYPPYKKNIKFVSMIYNILKKGI